MTFIIMLLFGAMCLGLASAAIATRCTGVTIALFLTPGVMFMSYAVALIVIKDAL